MKKLTAILIVCTMLVCTLTGCTNGEKKDTPTTAVDPSKNTSGAEQESGSKGSILMFTSANVGDFRIVDSAYAGAQKVSKELGYDLTLIELGGDTSIAESSLSDACASGKYQYIITGHQGMKDIYEAMAAKFPEITFIMYDTAETYEIKTPNMIAIAFKQYDGSYLAGMYSALMTNTGKVAVGCWDDNPIINDFATGYVNGVKDANDFFGLNVEYKVVYYGGDTTDATGAYEIANATFNDGCDVFYNVAGHVVLSAAKACEEHGGFEAGYYVVGVDTDQWTKYNSSTGVDAFGYENIATSMIKDAESTIFYVFQGLENGTIKPGDLVSTGIVEGGVRLAYNDNYYALTPEDVQERIADAEAKIRSGEKEVKSYYDFATYEDFAAYRDDPTAR